MRMSFVKLTQRYAVCAFLSSFALAGVLSTPAAASCSSCNCTSSTDYLPDHDGGICSNSSCVIKCAQSPTLTAWSPELTGIEVSDNAQPVVVAIYPNSPADQAGIRLGDILLKIDGKALPYSCSSDEGGLEEYLIKRGTRMMKIFVRRVSVAEILLRASDVRFRKVGLKDLDRLPSLSPYISGAILRKTTYGFLVDRVIPGTPAEVAGLKRGARVLAILEASTNQPSNAGEGADYRAELRFVLMSGGVITTKTLTLRGLSEILNDISAPHKTSPFIASLGVGQ